MDGIQQSEEEKGSCSPYQEVVNNANNDTANGAIYGPGKLASGGEKGGFVVYKQTVDLVNMLEKSINVDEM